MIKALLEFLPIEIVAGIAVFLGLTWLITPALQARDIENRGYLKQCQAGIRSGNAKMAKRLRIPSAEDEILKGLRAKVAIIYGRGKPNPFSILGIDKIIEASGRQKRRQVEGQIAKNSVDSVSYCKCLVSKTKSESRQAYVIWIASLAIVENIGVGESFYDVLTGLEQNGACRRKV